MHRRTLLSSIGTVVTASGAGCLVNSSDDGETSPGNQTSPSPGTPATLTDSSIRFTDGECGERCDAASVQFERDPLQVTVTGTIWGTDLRKIPVLEATHYDGETDELTVTVTTRNREGDEQRAGGQCLTGLDYVATVSFDGRLPGSVTVTHDHGDNSQTVATGTPAWYQQSYE